MTAIEEGTGFDAAQVTEILPIEEIEAAFQRWMLEHASLLSMPGSDATSQFEKRMLHTEQILIKMTFDYAIISLYQNTLVVDRALITDWAAALIRSSRSALWSSITSLVETLGEALDENLITLLPVNMLITVFVPLTIYTLYLQSVRIYDPLAIQNLAKCSAIAKIMIDLHDGAGFYATILSNTLIIADRWKAKQGNSEVALIRGDARAKSCTDRPEAETILPHAQLYSLILRYQGLAIALGRMPELEGVMPKHLYIQEVETQYPL